MGKDCHSTTPRDDATPQQRIPIGDARHRPIIHSRRGFLARASVMGSVALTSTLAGCGRGGDALGDLGGDDGPGSPTDAPDLALRAGLAIGLGPTAVVGLAGPSDIDPDEPGGGRLVTVETVDPGEALTVSWRRTVERTRTPETPPTAGVGEATPTPETAIVEERGRLTATGLDDAHAALLPMYWRPGETTTETSAIWLSRAAFRELRATRETAWSPDVLTRISRLSDEAIARIEEGVATVDEVLLTAEDDFVTVDLTVDGTQRAIQAIEAYDTFGNRYTILDRERNPLIVKFTYDAVSTGFAGIDAGLWSLIKTVFSGYQVASIDRP